MVLGLKSVPAEDKSCLAGYSRIIYMIRVCTRIVGADVIDPNYRLTWVTYIIISLLTNFFLCTFYSMYVGYKSSGDFTVILQVICFVGAGVQATVKLICFINYPDTLRVSQIFLHETYKKYEKFEGQYTVVLQRSLDMTRMIIKAIACMYIMIAISLIFFPLVYYIVQKKKILIMQFLVPGLDPYSNHGFFLLTCLHASCLCLGAFGNFSSDMYILIFIGNVSLVKNILRCKLNDLNVRLEQGAEPAEVRYAMQDIVRWHMEYLKQLKYEVKIHDITNSKNCCELTNSFSISSMLDRMQLICFWIIIAMVGCNAMSILATMYCHLNGIWPAASFLLIFSFMNLYLYCGLGTMVDTANEDCVDVIYTECRWYDLPVVEQRFILLMLRKAQNTSSLNIGSMMPLTVNTALQLTKTVYSLVMVLMRE
ncbi:odorant receptor 67d-like [Drosophila busckii]|uniref:odorant receptor 67d-like n=1 Tax=Drosophila busckii TaxID=30019 RepID=UPI00083EC47F|nr:odorant receptor 67d-like [Drosophila busckii]